MGDTRPQVFVVVDDPRWSEDEGVVRAVQALSESVKAPAIVCGAEGFCIVGGGAGAEETCSAVVPECMRDTGTSELSVWAVSMAQAAYLACSARVLVYIRRAVHHGMITQTCDFMVAQAGNGSDKHRPFIAVFNVGTLANPATDGFRARVGTSFVDLEVFTTLPKVVPIFLSVYGQDS